MSEIFNLRRFGRYIAYDLRNAWKNYGFALLVSGLAPLILLVFHEFISLVFDGSLSEVHAVEKVMAAGAVFAVTYMIAPGKIYGKITDRRAGSEYLTLPASTLEKWLSLLLVICVAMPVCLVAVYGAADWLLGLCLPGVYGPATWKGIEFVGSSVEMWDGAYMNTLAMGLLGQTQSILIFTLGALCFRKSKVAKTILASFLVSTVFGTLSSVVMFQGFFDMDEVDAGLFLDQLNLMLNLIYWLVFAVLAAAIYYRLRTIKH